MRTDTNFWLFSVPFVINPLLIIVSLFLLSPCCLFAHVYHFTITSLLRSSPFLSFITVPFIHHHFFHSSSFLSFIIVSFRTLLITVPFVHYHHCDFTLINHLLLFHFVISSLPSFHYHRLLFLRFVHQHVTIVTSIIVPHLTSFRINHHIACIQILTLLDVVNISSFNNIEYFGLVE